MIAAAVVLFLAGCATEEVPVVSLPPTTRTIAVVADVPNELRLGTEGITVFENCLDMVDIADWRLDDVAFGAIRTALPEKYRAIRANADGTSLDLEIALLSNSQSIAKFMREHIRAPEEADVYFILYASPQSHPYIQKPIVLQDVGVSKERVPIGDFSPVAHCYPMLAVVDGRTFKLLADTPLLMNPNRPSSRDTVFFEGGGAAYPIQPLDNFEWKDRWRDLTAAQRELIHRQIRSLLADSLAYTVAKSGMAQ